MTTVTQERSRRVLTEDAPLFRERESEPYVVTSAETAECCCPDACERDHDNE